MSTVKLIWEAALGLLGVGCLIAVLFVLTILIITAVKTIKKEVQNDDSKNVS